MNYRRVFDPVQRRRRRYNAIVEALGITAQDTILDVGCGQGISFEVFNATNPIVGVDLGPTQHMASNFRHYQGDAGHLPFANGEFDVAVSIGCFEHIRPMAHLDDCIREIDRVAHKGLVVVPCITTPLEPHFHSFFWQLRSYNRRILLGNRNLGFEPAGEHERITYLSDDAWLNFDGFSKWRTMRYWHIPPVVENLFILKV